MIGTALKKVVSSGQVALQAAGVGVAGTVRAEAESAAFAHHDIAGCVAACVLVSGPHSLPRNRESHHMWDRCKTPVHVSADAPGEAEER